MGLKDTLFFPIFGRWDPLLLGSWVKGWFNPLKLSREAIFFFEPLTFSQFGLGSDQFRVAGGWMGGWVC